SLIAVLALAACGSGKKAFRYDDVPGEEEDGGGVTDDLAPSELPDAAVAPDLRMKQPPPSTDGLPCPANKQYLLILDFRSGWWTAGGGATFYTVVMPFLSSTCGGVQLEYHHYEAAQMGTPQTQWYCTYDGGKGSCNSGGFQDILSTIIEQDWTRFTQFWILSGDKEDPSD